jgi:cellulose synthase/poly-beta-1,6-N-acetylglucosamine synthase-like glycosyltransferase
MKGTAGLIEMSRKPFASIVVITYNNAGTIEECLSSLVTQSYPNKEIIVVYDEGSKDGTNEVLDRLAFSYKGSFRVISVPHMGRSKARNVGWRNSSGEVVFFADADDIFFKDFLEKAVLKLESDPSMGGVCLTNSPLIKGSSFLAGCMEVYSKLQQAAMERSGFKPSWALVYKREALEKVGGFDESLEQAEDKDLLIRVTGAGYGVGLVSGVNWLHRGPTSLWAHLKKTYLGSMRRIPFIAKHGEWLRLVLSLLPFWFIILLFALSTTYLAILASAFACFAVFVIVRTIGVARLVWSKVEKKHYILLYPFFNLIVYPFSAGGRMHGLVLFLLKKKNLNKINATCANSPTLGINGIFIRLAC